jgi:pimeloyl-ACP methyl ester carboxylesterase
MRTVIDYLLGVRLSERIRSLGKIAVNNPRIRHPLPHPVLRYHREMTISAQTILAAAIFVAAIRAMHAQPASGPSDPMSLPTPTGTYGVGRTSYTLTDASRPEPLSATPGAKRRIMVFVWYPTDRKTTAATKAAPYLPGFDIALPKLSAGDLNGMFRPSKFRGLDQLPQTKTVENAPIASGKQQFPVLLFSHGWGNPTFLYTAELQDIVSHGYIVVAVDHPYDTSYTLFPDGELTLFAQDRFNEESKKPNGLTGYAKERVEVMGDDNKFALGKILELANTPSLHASFYKRIDEREIGAFGHSIGGLAAARTCQIDPRVKACIDQDSDDGRGSPFIVTPLDQTQKQPFLLFVVASADLWSPATVNPTDADLAAQKMTRADYDAVLRKHQATETEQLTGIQGGSYRVMLFNLPGFTHRSFTDQTLLDFAADQQSNNLHNFQVAQAYVLAFFDKFLKGPQNTALDSPTPIDSRARVDKFQAHISPAQ